MCKFKCSVLCFPINPVKLQPLIDSIFLLTIAAVVWNYFSSRGVGICGWVAPLTPSNYYLVVLGVQAAPGSKTSRILPVTSVYYIPVDHAQWVCFAYECKYLNTKTLNIDY